MRPEPSVRWGLIGYGAWGTHHARTIAKTPGAQLVAIAARSEASRAAAQAEHPGAAVHSDYRELLAGRDLDVVDVVVPSDLHYEIAKAVLESGRHLLLEKPMALRLEHCEELIGLAQGQKRLLAVGFELRLSSLWGKVKDLIEAGGVGAPLYGLIELWRNPYRLGAGGWRYDIRRVGNWILEEPIHFFDLARWYFAQAGPPVSVYAQANGKQPDHPELHDNFSALVAFPQGRYAVISQTLAAYEHHQVAKITGTQGALWAAWSGAMDRTRHPTFSLKHFDGNTVHEIPIEKIPGELFELEDEIATVTAAVRQGTPLAATGEDGRWAVALCLKAQESVETGRVIPFAHG